MIGVVLNALVHKDYAAATPVQISVYADKLMIWNPGELPPDWTVDRLMEKHPSRPYNPDVANAFFRAGMIESWGRGIERILEACRVAEVPEPVIRYETDGLWVEFQFKAVLDETNSITTQETTQEKIIAHIKGNFSITRRELAEKIGLSDDGVKYHLQKLKAAGVIEHVGSTKAGQWKILK
ncbi:MAG: winged helix-turn-helix transcriptional regulator [Desulfuromonadales bacterium]|nr:winged helix-turn-helix transcriptional regulator [Desulfuromonadales bacterium]